MSNTSSGLIATRYAIALLDMAAEAKAMEPVERDMQELAAMMESSPELRTLVANPLIDRNRQKNVVAALAQTAKFNNLTRNFLGVLAQNRRLSVLPAVIRAFRTEAAKRRGEVEARVQTAYALTPAQTEQLRQELTKALGSHVALNVEVQKDLLGGMVVTVGSLMIDDSLKRKLERLKRTLSGSRAA
jgi:F-type H+-transporting ATPase subunit delta